MSDKKYPWIKSLFKKNSPAAGVYAGPEMMQKNKGGEPSPGPVEVVYAGPEIQPPPDMPVYAGPVFEDEPPVEDVYAGPVPDEDPDEAPEEEAEEPEKSAPEQKAAPDPRMFMMVYAGPDYFANRQNAAPMFAPDAEKKLFCPDCGTPNRTDSKFCTECGAKLIK